jgi:hypothetical protein
MGPSTVVAVNGSEWLQWVDPCRWVTAPRTAGIGHTGAIGQAASRGGPFTRQRLREPTPRTGLGAARAGTRVRFWPLVDPARRGLFASSVTADMIRRQVAAPSSSPASASSLARAALSSSALSP